MWAGHGPINLQRALAVSCNPYFQWVGEQLGYERIQRYAHLLGLGEPSGINLTGETAGRVPLFVKPAAVGHLSSHAEGIETSAVQLAVLLSATVNGGVVLRPQVSGAADFVPSERWRLPATTRLDGLAAQLEVTASAGFTAKDDAQCAQPDATKDRQAGVRFPELGDCAVKHRRHQRAEQHAKPKRHRTA